MNRYHQTLALLSDGASIEQIATRTDRSRDAIKAMIESMQRAGHLKAITCTEETCTSCPLADACTMALEGPTTYVVTDAGRTVLQDAAGDQ